LRRDSPQALRSRHGRAGRPILSPLIPGCSVAGDQGPSRSPVRGPMPRRCSDCKLAAPRQRPSAPRPREDGFWRRMAARPPRATRRAASAPSGPRRAEGSGGRHVRTHWFMHAHLPNRERCVPVWLYADPYIANGCGDCQFNVVVRIETRRSPSMNQPVLASHTPGCRPWIRQPA
jgi:hypothetical protein